ncbi:LysR family transcriptional regulator [Cytobacillus gottheilii]|uniref:LysR family transcriptional regulator n=1 Tax=Cytobacillus gottheilii TaxID=859144 RepID=UPI0009B953B7|nr:LysR family transcriptional regulator [Cytobacillus gottheilii]
MFTLQQYEILQAIHKEGQLTKVAEHLKLSQPTITFHIKKMEEKCQLALVEYRGRRTMLTSTGKILLPYIEKILQVHNQAKQTLLDIQHVQQGSIMIGVSNTVASSIIPSALPNIYEQFPESEIKIHVHNARAIREMLHDYSIDIGIVVAHREDVDEFISIPIKEDPIGIAMNSQHPLASYSLELPQLFKNERVLLREEDSTTTKTFRKWCDKEELQFRYELEIQSAEAIKKSILANAGIAVVSKLSVEQEIKEGSLLFKEFDANKRRSVFLIYHPNRRLSPIQKGIIELIEDL